MQPTPELISAYRDWLGIGSHELPADHYRLLGVTRFETDIAKIVASAEVRMAQLRTYQMGPRGPVSQQLLNEVAVARNCLTVPEQKAAYDAWLQHALQVQYQNFLQQGGPPPIGMAPQAGQLPPPLPPPLPDSAGSAATAELPASAGNAAWLSDRRVWIGGGVLAVVLVAGITWGVGRIFRPEKKSEPIAKAPEVTPQKESDPTLPGSDAKKNNAGPQEVKPNAEGMLELLPQDAQVAEGVERQGEDSEAILIGWNQTDAIATWNVKLTKPSFFKVDCIYTATEAAMDRTLEIVVDDGVPARINLKPSGTDVKARTDTVLTMIKTSGPHTVTVRVKNPVDTGDWLKLRTLRMYPQAAAHKR